MYNKIPMWVGIGGAVIMFVAAGAAFYFQDQIGARVLSTKTRNTVKQGETVTLSINATKAPSVKIDLCQEVQKNPKCQTLLAKATGQKANVTIPANFPLGKATLKIQERDKAGKLTGKLQPNQLVTVVKGAVVTTASGGGGSGGGGGGSGSGGSGGGSSGGGTVTNNSGPLFDEQNYEDVGRKITIQSAHNELIAGQTERVTVTYAIDHWPGTYKGQMQIFVQSTEISNVSGGEGAGRVYDPEGLTYRWWSYEIPNGQSRSFSFDMKVPPKGFKGRDTVNVEAQFVENYGPQYLAQDGTAPEGPINVSRGNIATWPIR